MFTRSGHSMFVNDKPYSYAHPKSNWKNLLKGIVILLSLIVAEQISLSATINSSNWGSVSSPVFGKYQTGKYAGAELFAGPHGAGNSYFDGVLPNGRIVRPAGISIQVGMNPLGSAITPDGRYLVVSNDDERGGEYPSLIDPLNHGGYSLSVIDTHLMKVVSQMNTDGAYFIGLVASGNGPYQVWASGGPDNSVKIYQLSINGALTHIGVIPISPILPSDKGYVSNYSPSAAFGKNNDAGFFPPVPSGFRRPSVDAKGNVKSPGGSHITFPSGLTLSPNGKYLYVACNGDNSIAVIDTENHRVIRQIPVGYFPYGVSVSPDGSKILVTNWGVTEYKFLDPEYENNGSLIGIQPVKQEIPGMSHIPVTNVSGENPKTSSVSIIRADTVNSDQPYLLKSIYLGHKLDPFWNVGDTHPSASAIVHRNGVNVLYITRTNSDSISLIDLNGYRRLPELDLSFLNVKMKDHRIIHGTYPNAITVSPDGKRAYAAEAGINSVAILDTTNPLHPHLLGRIPTGWYPSSLLISPDGKYLYVTNAKGIGEDKNTRKDNPDATGIESFSDSNYIFGTVQKIDLAAVNSMHPIAAVAENNCSIHTKMDTSIVPIGGIASKKIKHVFFIMQENKTFDSMLGNIPHFGPYSSIIFNNPDNKRFAATWGSHADGSPFADVQFTRVCPNTRLIAEKFATGVNYYSDSEESDAGHQFCASGTASDYTEKTLLVKDGRGLLVNKNFEPEDYPESGYIFNNAARNGVSFKDYGDMIRIMGTDTGGSVPTRLDDPNSGLVGYPALDASGKIITPLANRGDVMSPTSGLGQSYFLSLPILAVMGQKNANGEPHLDANYPGYNFNISDQRRALEFIRDFNRMEKAGKIPQFLYIYLPNDHTGGVNAPNKKEVVTIGAQSPLQQVADGDTGLGMVIQRIMKSPLYYNPATGEGSAIFITYDDAQSTLDHIHQHRTPMMLVSPYARPGYIAKRHYSTASIVKTEELLLGLPPNNLGDLMATDLRDMFQNKYNGITADQLHFTRRIAYVPSPEGKRIWKLVDKLDTSAPDRDSARLGELTRLCIQADELHKLAVKRHHLYSKQYRDMQAKLYRMAQTISLNAPNESDND
jgi:YVTN family beta-propeller protein